MIQLAIAFLGLVMVADTVPLSTPSHAWNRPGVSEAEFAADSEACAAIYTEALPHAAVRPFRRGEIVSGGLNQYSGTTIDDEDAIEAWDECFRSRGYLATGLSRPERRQIYGRFITEAVRLERLYAIALAEDRRVEAPARTPTAIIDSVVTDHPVQVAPD